MLKGTPGVITQIYANPSKINPAIFQSIFFIILIILINKDVVHDASTSNYFNTLKEYQHEYLYKQRSYF